MRWSKAIAHFAAGSCSLATTVVVWSSMSVDKIEISVVSTAGRVWLSAKNCRKTSNISTEIVWFVDHL